eukprot:CAMPEP_0168610310 /NCGR_PEP_ID=MMETSP0449_2-20121227/1713_1 /TAXON_ID=1082188 /ORGANISM="Strombidium rassoulzadegani, Strain ras09" /LENGTH=301 /DNA_ID=CAMNT_0008650595 /DNA_START=375 /DNA_END=1277 /DNA_ORIENTATION=+
MLDLHANLLILNAFGRTSLTSVMLMEDFTIPSAVILSILLLKVRYQALHFLALLLCLGGMSLSFYNDMFIRKDEEVVNPESETQKQASKLTTKVIGDIMALSGAFINASNNILAEHLLKSQSDVYHYLGFLGLFGSLAAFVEATFIFGDTYRLLDKLAENFQDNSFFILWNVLLFSGMNFVCYSLIPLYISRCGATLFNLSNVTTVIWGMLSDLILFKKAFYPFYIIAFVLEIMGVALFSLKKPRKKGELLSPTSSDNRNNESYLEDIEIISKKNNASFLGKFQTGRPDTKLYTDRANLSP